MDGDACKATRGSMKVRCLNLEPICGNDGVEKMGHMWVESRTPRFHDDAEQQQQQASKQASDM